MAQDIIARGLAIKALEEGGGGSGDHPVTSVNGKTGAVMLNANDVGAATQAYVDAEVVGIFSYDDATQTLSITI